MAWTTPKTWTTGEVLTAANMNAQVRDNENFLAGPPMARAYNSAAISAANAALTALTFDSEKFDTDAIHSTVSATGRLTCKTAGKYMIGGHVSYASNATGNRGLFVLFNGGTYLAGLVVPTPGGGDLCRVSVSTLYQMAVNDFVQLVYYQTSGGALNIVRTDAESPEFWMAWQSN